MVRRPIRNLHSNLQNPPRVFDVIIDDDGKTYLEVKTGKSLIRIPWNDVVFQVEAIETAAK